MNKSKNLEVSNCARSAKTNAFPSSKTLVSHWRRCKNKEMATHSDTYYKGIPQKPQNCKRKASTLLILRRRSNSKGQVHRLQELCICVLRAARMRGPRILVYIHIYIYIEREREREISPSLLSASARLLVVL